MLELVMLLGIYASYPAQGSPFEEPPPSKDYAIVSLYRAAKTVGVPPTLLKAICTAESGLITSSYNSNDGGKGNSAFGLCQVLLRTAQEHGFHSEKCNGSFSKTPPKDRNYNACGLFGAYTNAFYAAKYLKSRLIKYDGSWISAIAAYNTGTLKICKTGKVRRVKDRKVIYTCKVGGLLNQEYVDRVLRALNNE